jgi:hypothetical protein
MSEHQYVAFRAIDSPVSEKQLKYMRRQSSRAEITPWSFDNEYHFGDFGGSAVEMLRRGYDLHLHYANFGVRTLMIRFPNGLPVEKAAAPYFEKGSLDYLRDKRGSGGILGITPFYEPDQLDDLWEFDDLLDSLVTLRGEIMNGDLRPVYLAHLAVASDGNHDPDEEREGPVPAGLTKLTNAQRALTEFYGLSDALISAAARQSPPLPKRLGSATRPATWLKDQSEAKKTEWLARLLADPHSAVRTEILAEFQKCQAAPAWPTVRSDRTIGELIKMADKS